MSVVSAAKAVLEADGTLVALATGGIWDKSETGAYGISRTKTPAAYDSNGIIKPCVLLKQRFASRDGVLDDDELQYVSVDAMLEVWAYEYSGFDNIDAMKNRIFTLLHGTQLTGTFQVKWVGDYRYGVRDVDLDAEAERTDYQIKLSKS